MLMIWQQIKNILENEVASKDCEATIASFEEVAVDTSSTSSKTTSTPRPPQPARSIIFQPDAPQDLDLVSWSVAKLLPWSMKGYACDVNFGRNTYIYIIDNGLNQMHRASGIPCE